MKTKIILIFLLVALFTISAFAFFLWKKVSQFKPEVYYYVPPEKSFVYTEEELKYGIEKYLREVVESKRKQLIADKKSFIDIDLKAMELTLYKEGEKFQVFPIQGKGEEWFWGETPPGVYSAKLRTRLHFSSVARVWMPYAVQFYGNYFIHGWPYDRAGRLLGPGPSGGCIRLRTPDAAVIFEFAEAGMPILIFDEKTASPLPALFPTNKEMVLPEINSQSFLVADLDTGEILLSKDVDSEIYAGPVVQGMLALVASESVNLEKRIIAKSWMFEEVEEKIIISGKSYQGYDLLQPLLLQSSKEAALVLSRFLTPEDFVILMNKKARGIGMKNTNFVDVTGISKENTTTLYDAAKMARYIKDYRKFIFAISNKLIGQDENKRETIFAVLKMKASDETSRFIFIGLANSLDVRTELENIMGWLNKNFNLDII